MKILLVTQYFWPENFVINDIAASLKQRGYQVTVLTGIPNYPDGQFFPDYGVFKQRRQTYQGVKLIRVPLVSRGKSQGLRLAVNYFSFAFSASLFSFFLREERYDLILVYEPSPITIGLPALVLKKWKRAPIMFWVQDLWPESLSATGAINSKIILKMIERLTRFIYRGCDLILVQSQAFFESIERLGVPRERIRYFPNSVGDFYSPISVEPKDSDARNDMFNGFSVMYGGNIGISQSFETILGAAEYLKKFQDIHWLIIGDGRMCSWVETQIQKRGLENTVFLLGRQPPEAMPHYFAMADVLLVTLKRSPIFALTVPSKLQAYLACAKPIIAALEGEGARIVEDAEVGITCPVEEPEAMAEAVLTMYRMPETERKAKGMRGRNYFEAHFKRSMLLERLDTWIRELVQEANSCVS